jgi:hypothetical protein
MTCFLPYYRRSAAFGTSLPWFHPSLRIPSPQHLVRMADGSMNGPGIVNGAVSVSGDGTPSHATFPAAPAPPHPSLLEPPTGTSLAYNTSLAALACPQAPVGNNTAALTATPVQPPPGSSSGRVPLQTMQPNVLKSSLTGGGSPAVYTGGSSTHFLFQAYALGGAQSAKGAWQGYGSQTPHVPSVTADSVPVTLSPCVPSPQAVSRGNYWAGGAKAAEPAAYFRLSKH